MFVSNDAALVIFDLPIIRDRRSVPYDEFGDELAIKLRSVPQGRKHVAGGVSRRIRVRKLIQAPAGRQKFASSPAGTEACSRWREPPDMSPKTSPSPSGATEIRFNARVCWPLPWCPDPPQPRGSDEGLVIAPRNRQDAYVWTTFRAILNQHRTWG